MSADASLFAARRATIVEPAGPLFAPPPPPRSRGATIEFAVLGSSSSGNGSVLRVRDGAHRRQILIDAGLSPKMTKGRMAALGFDFDETDEILFTHFDQDHAKEGWGRVGRTGAIAFRCARAHRSRAIARGYPAESIHDFDPDRGAFALGPVRVSPCVSPHDDGGTIAFRLETPAGTLGFATDLGRVSGELIAAMRGADILAIESNYDPRMQLESARPAMLKDRIMGGSGHLSNEECLDAVRAIAAHAEPAHVVLLHLSRECNCPDLVRSRWRAALPRLDPRLVIARPFEAVGPSALAAPEPAA
ncbi:MAG: MBL fold metallo-hydrolase [Planctomycetota bacterium]